jgi:hypothetical protein
MVECLLIAQKKGDGVQAAALGLLDIQDATCYQTPFVTM